MFSSEIIGHQESLPRIGPANLPPRDSELHWYVISSRANHEKRIAQHCELRQIEHLLPLYESCRQRKDRRVRLQSPLFPGYIFVRISLADRIRVLQIPGVVYFLTSNGIPIALPDCLIAGLCASQLCREKLGPHPNLTTGCRVRLIRGPLQGWEGILLRKKTGLRVVLSVDLIRRSVFVEVDPADVARC